MTLSIGTRLGPYEILSPLGAGDVSADGQRFLVNTEIPEVQSPLTLVVNWTAGLER